MPERWVGTHMERRRAATSRRINGRRSRQERSYVPEVLVALLMATVILSLLMLTVVLPALDKFAADNARQQFITSPSAPESSPQ
ncbi:MAG: hypothetical protein H0U58_02070 [Chloroflexi bacterium]|nr:hypothetical protein [Chloroflexota bacterium]